MTVRAVVTASGRVESRRARATRPTGEVQRDGGGAIDGALRVELERALAVADRANNAVAAGARRALDGAGRSDRRRADRRGAQGRAGGRRARRAASQRVGEVPFSSERKLMSTVHTRRRAPGAAARVHQGRAGRPARALLAGARRRGAAAADRRAPRGDSRSATTRWPARRCARSASPSARCRRTARSKPTNRRARRAGSGVRWG